jgi:hypothetical protein
MVKASREVLEYLNSIVASCLTMPAQKVDWPREVVASNLIVLRTTAKYARSLSVARGSHWASLGHSSSTSSTDSAPLILCKASATLLQSTNQKLDTTLAFEILRTSQLVEIIGEFLSSLTKVERFESLLVVCFRGLNWRRCFLGWRRANAFPSFRGRLGYGLGRLSGLRA